VLLSYGSDVSSVVLGQRFGAYLVDGIVGEGGMGTVYRARDSRLGRPVALKVLRTDPQQGPPAAEVVARFVGEARMGASLTHPNIVAILEAGAVGDTPYLAMEWLDGRSLADLIEARALGQPQKLAILDQMADALAYAHGRGVIHRDVKPTNVMVDAQGNAKLVDFGIAKQSGGFAGSSATMIVHTHARALLGTPGYMAPEQALSPTVDARADQFSWAVVAYLLLSGVHPAESVGEGGPAFPIARPRPLGWVAADVPDAIAAVIHRAMSTEADARFATMSDLRGALRAARGLGGGEATPSPYVTAPQPLSLATTPAPPIGAAMAPTFGDASRPPMAWTPASSPGHAPPAGTPPPAFGTPPPAFGAPPPALGTPPPALGTPPPALGAPPPALGAPPPAFGAPRNRGAAIWAVAGVGVLVVVGGVVAGVLLLGGHASALPLPAPAIGGGTSTRAVLESGVDDLKFTGPPVQVEKTKADLVARVSPCAVGKLADDLWLAADVFVKPDGTVDRVEEVNVCRETHPSHFICTEKGTAKPKRGYPTAPEEVYTCFERALKATRFPPPVPDKWDAAAAQRTSLHFELK